MSPHLCSARPRFRPICAARSSPRRTRCSAAIAASTGAPCAKSSTRPMRTAPRAEPRPSPCRRRRTCSCGRRARSIRKGDRNPARAAHRFRLGQAPRARSLSEHRRMGRRAFSAPRRRRSTIFTRARDSSTSGSRPARLGAAQSARPRSGASNAQPRPKSRDHRRAGQERGYELRGLGSLAPHPEKPTQWASRRIA